MKKTRTIEALIPLLVLASCDVGTGTTYKLSDTHYRISKTETICDELVIIDGKEETKYVSSANLVRTAKFNSKKTSLDIESEITYTSDVEEQYYMVNLTKSHKDTESGKEFSYAYILDPEYKETNHTETKTDHYESDTMEVNVTENRKTYKYPKIVGTKKKLGTYYEYQKLMKKNQYDEDAVFDGSVGNSYYDTSTSKFFPIITKGTYEDEKESGKLGTYEAKWLISYTEYKTVEKEISWKTIEVKL